VAESAFYPMAFYAFASVGARGGKSRNDGLIERLIARAIEVGIGDT